jgi:adenylate cyclase
MDLTMRGWALVFQASQTPTKDNYDAARALFGKALGIDPNDADALAGDALTYATEFGIGWRTPETDYDAKILGQADRAIALAPDNVKAYLAKSNYLTFLGRANEGLGVADAGLAVNPNSASLYTARSFADIFLGRFEQTKSDVLIAMRLSPRDPSIGLWHTNLGIAELGLNHFGAAIDEFRKAIDGGYRPYVPYTGLAAAYALVGKMEEAKSALGEARSLNPKLTVKWLMTVWGNQSELYAALRKAGLPEE